MDTPIDPLPAAAPRSLRIAPAVVIVLLAAAAFVWLVWFAEPTLLRLFGVFLTPALAGIALLIWWLAFSRATARAKVGVTLGGAALVAAALFLAHPFASAFAALWGVPGAAGAAVLIWAALPRASRRVRARGALLGALAAFAPWLALRTAGQIGEGMITFAPRWQPDAPGVRWSAPTNTASRPAASQAALVAGAFDWTGFRGPNRNSVAIASSAWRTAAAPAPPARVWSKRVGLGWSSYALIGDHIFTQEQRDELECVVAYSLSTGSELWVHADRNRFDEISGGAGPRATPTFADGSLYVFGPSGLLTCLDAASGAVRWQYTEFAQLKPPTWGFASSPLIVGDLVVVGLCGAGGIRLSAHRRADGAVAWQARGGDSGYSSPHAATLAGVEQILYLDGAGFTGHAPSDGRELWRYDWPTKEPKTIQPWPLDDKTVLIGMGYGYGLRRLEITPNAAGAWQAREVWRSNRLKTKFNDFVCTNGLAVGLDEGILACIDLATGERRWKGGRYGYGQVLLLPTEGSDAPTNTAESQAAARLIVLAEDGSVHLLAFDGQGARELLAFDALTGKTWNHPVLTPEGLLIRNGEEAQFYRIAADGNAQPPTAPQ